MLHLLDESLESYFRASLAAGRDIDISFERPDGTWGAGITRPTLNLHLWDIKPASAENQAGYELVEVEGRVVRRSPLPRIHFRYMVTAWTNDMRDQHQLLGSVLIAVLKTPYMTSEHLRTPLADAVPAPLLRLANNEPARTTDFWSASHNDMRAALDLLVTVSVDAASLVEVGPPTTGVTVGVTDTDQPSRTSSRTYLRGETDPEFAGRVVRSPRGTSVVNADGSFAVIGQEGDEIVCDGPDGPVVVTPGDGEASPAGRNGGVATPGKTR